jgi:hypothetical protein
MKKIIILQKSKLRKTLEFLNCGKLPTWHEFKYEMLPIIIRLIVAISIVSIIEKM